ncbi:Uma2 family endonuclease [Microbispora hainanensis]|uniref:Uma2 family endonuclease n=1 Tax=Microbispora hainanensis TaxID=568844 RepID=A0A544YIH6_9ACTN|nr:Uma2 family endonuclease [Microbispora hainanensis]TQS16561.1 Uma2 family endonuclease [Microbispora hainanensis]
MSVAYDDREHSYHHGPYTIADLDRMPRDARYELVDGWIVMSPWPSIRHDHAVRNLRTRLDAAVARAGADLYVNGPVDVFTSTGIRVPDVAVVDGRAARRAVERDERAYQGVDLLLVVEVVSRESASERTDRYEKPSEYAKAGIAQYWVVDLEPKPNVTVWALMPGHDVYPQVDRVFAGDLLKTDVPVELSIDPAVLLSV